MPFLASPAQPQTLPEAWDLAQQIARSIKSVAQAQKDASAAGPVVASWILQFEAQLRVEVSRLATLAAMPGIGTYVSSLPDTSQGYDVAAAYTAMRDQMNATVAWIQGNYPKAVDPLDGQAHMLERVMTANGPVERTFSTAVLASYRTQLDALLSTIG